MHIAICFVYSKARFTLEAKGHEEKHFSQWEAKKLRRPRNVTLNVKFLV